MYKVITEFLNRFFKASTIYKYGFNWSPMYRRTTAKIIEVSDDLYKVKIRLKPNWKNRNYAGTIFGGSMLSATDPIYMIQLLQILGNNYVVWDKMVEARYKRPAKSVIYGTFQFSKKEIETLKKNLAEQNEMDICKSMDLVDTQQNIIATFKKTMYVANSTFYKKNIENRKYTNN